jgi:hypothetical protein
MVREVPSCCPKEMSHHSSTSECHVASCVHESTKRSEVSIQIVVHTACVLFVCVMPCCLVEE